MTMVCAYILNKHHDKFHYEPVLAEGSKDNEEWWAAWSEAIEREGYAIRGYESDDHYNPYLSRTGHINELLASDRLWVAAVNSKVISGTSHVIVMKGSKLEYDSSRKPRKRKPTKIHYGFTLESLEL